MENSSTEEVADLKPCPFNCKTGLLKVYRLPDSDSRHIYCSACNSAGPWGDTYEEAARLWNTRSEEVETLRTENAEAVAGSLAMTGPLEVGSEVYINPAWCRCGRGGVCRVSRVGGYAGVRLIQLEGGATHYGQHYLLGNQTRWRSMYTRARAHQPYA